MGSAVARRAADARLVSGAGRSGRACRRRTAGARCGAGRRGRLAVAQPRRGRPAVPRVLAARRDRGAAAPPARRARRAAIDAGRRARARGRRSRPAPRRRTGHGAVDRPRAARGGALHVGVERRAQGRAAHAGDARVQGHAHGRRARPAARRLRAHARAVRAHLRAAQRHHPAGRRSVPQRAHGALGSGGRARPHRTRAGHVHGRPADVLRRAHAGARFHARAGGEPAPDLVGRRRSERRVRRGSVGGVRRGREAHLRLDRSADDRDEHRNGRRPRDAHTHDGHAIGSVELRVVDGELRVRGPEVCVGYLDAAQNADAFDADGWFRTGDLATLDDAVGSRSSGGSRT